MLEILGLPTEARVLDLACGWGRYAVPLQEAGLRVIGFDRSLSLLKAAQRQGAGDDRVQWVCGDMRALPFIGSFDAVLSLFSSLGYFGSEAEDLRVLRSVATTLRPEGRLLLETMHRDAVVRDFAERDWWEGEGGERVWAEREFDTVHGGEPGVAALAHSRWQGRNQVPRGESSCGHRVESPAGRGGAAMYRVVWGLGRLSLRAGFAPPPFASRSGMKSVREQRKSGAQPLAARPDSGIRCAIWTSEMPC